MSAEISHSNPLEVEPGGKIDAFRSIDSVLERLRSRGPVLIQQGKLGSVQLGSKNVLSTPSEGVWVRSAVFSVNDASLLPVLVNKLNLPDDWVGKIVLESQLLRNGEQEITIGISDPEGNLLAITNLDHQFQEEILSELLSSIETTLSEQQEYTLTLQFPSEMNINSLMRNLAEKAEAEAKEKANNFIKERIRPLLAAGIPDIFKQISNEIGQEMFISAIYWDSIDIIVDQKLDSPDSLKLFANQLQACLSDPRAWVPPEREGVRTGRRPEHLSLRFNLSDGSFIQCWEKEGWPEIAGVQIDRMILRERTDGKKPEWYASKSKHILIEKCLEVEREPEIEIPEEIPPQTFLSRIRELFNKNKQTYIEPPPPKRKVELIKISIPPEEITLKVVETIIEMLPPQDRKKIINLV